MSAAALSAILALLCIPRARPGTKHACGILRSIGSFMVPNVYTRTPIKKVQQNRAGLLRDADMHAFRAAVSKAFPSRSHFSFHVSCLHMPRSESHDDERTLSPIALPHGIYQLELAAQTVRAQS